MSAESAAEVKQLIQQLSNTWLEERIDDLPPFFDEQVVLVTPDGDEINGREQMIDSFALFMRLATVYHFEIENIDVKLFETTAIARYTFEIDYEISDKRSLESGIETLVLLQGTAGWRIVWRTQQHAPKSMEIEML